MPHMCARSFNRRGCISVLTVIDKCMRFTSNVNREWVFSVISLATKMYTNRERATTLQLLYLDAHMRTLHQHTHSWKSSKRQTLFRVESIFQPRKIQSKTIDFIIHPQGAYLVINVLFAPFGRDVRRQVFGELHGRPEVLLALAHSLAIYSKQRWAVFVVDHPIRPEVMIRLTSPLHSSL